MKRIAAVLILASPLLAQAAEPIRLADNSAQPRFFPLDAARNGQQPMKAKPAAASQRPATALRSDASSMNKGFFRIDRKQVMATAPAPKHALIITPSAKPQTDAPRVILGAPAPAATAAAESTGSNAISTPDHENPVLSLFNNTGDNTLPSFRDALTGRNAATPVGTMHRWPLPLDVPQKISSAYGYRADPINRKMGFHSGVDIASATGTPVLATADGQVTKVGNDGLYGLSVSIAHADGSESQYGHLHSQSVAVGQRVRSGQTIGTVGATGRVTGAHLDYRISKNGVTLDPMSVLARPTHIAAAAPGAKDSHVHPATPTITRPRVLAKSERLIVVR